MSGLASLATYPHFCHKYNITLVLDQPLGIGKADIPATAGHQSVFTRKIEQLETHSGRHNPIGSYFYFFP